MKTRIMTLFLLVLLASCKNGSPDKTTENMRNEIPESKSPQKVILESLTNYISSNVLDFSSIKEERKALLNEIARYVSQRSGPDEPTNLIFICSANSRRSHMSQLWAQVAAFYYKVPGIQCYSGGTDATAFNQRAISALERAGFQIKSETPGLGGNETNTVYMIKYAEGVTPVEGFSKKFSDPYNPQAEFATLMTCSDADEACPIVPGAEIRFSIPFEDPKIADNTPEEEAAYDERSKQIATEMFYVFSTIKND